MKLLLALALALAPILLSPVFVFASDDSDSIARNRKLRCKAGKAPPTISKAAKTGDEVCLKDPFGASYDDPCMCGVDEATIVDSRTVQTSISYYLYTDAEEDLGSVVSSIEESVQKAVIETEICGPLSKDIDDVLITEISSSSPVDSIIDGPCPAVDGAPDGKECRVVSGGFVFTVGVSASHVNDNDENAIGEERMLQLDKQEKKELEAQIDAAILQLQNELGLSKNEATALEKKLNKALKAAIKSLSSGGESIEIVIDGGSINVVVLPPVRCGASFTNEKVDLSANLDCGAKTGDKQLCALSLIGPQAEINCNGNKLSQVASPNLYIDGPYGVGICLFDGAKATNCNVEQFATGIRVTNGGEVVESNLSSNNSGMNAIFNVDSTVTVENTDASNNKSAGLYIDGYPDGLNAQLIMKGNVTANSNGNFGGMYTYLEGSNMNLVIDVQGSFQSCGNDPQDIYYEVEKTSSSLEYTGSGYTCDKVYDLLGNGGTNIVEPECQSCGL